MQRLILVASATWPLASASSPIAKVVSMLSDLQTKVIHEGEVAQKEFAEFTEWCEERSRNLGFEIKTGSEEAAELKAAIAKEVAVSASLTTKIEQLAGEIKTDEADLKAATEIRSKEASVFTAAEKDLTDTIDTLRRAVRLIEQEMTGGASMLQLKNANNFVEALSAMVQASMLGTSDVAKLTAFFQSSHKAADTEEEVGAPAGAAYESHSGDILSTLEDLLEKAEAQMDDARNKETADLHSFEMLKQSLEDELSYGQKSMDAAKKNLAASSEKKSVAEGDLDATSKELNSDSDVKETLHQTCMRRAEEFQASTSSRNDELTALAKAKKLIVEATSGAALDQSFLQVARFGASSGNPRVVRLIRDLALKEHSSSLAQLASRMASVIAAGGADPFQKVKGLIRDMISKLEAEAGADATKKAYCDKELKESNAKKDEKTTEIEKLSTRIDQMSARSATLKEEVATLQLELSKLAKSQAGMDKLRQEEKAAFISNKAEQEKGLEGIKLALKVLREYYAQDASHDASSDDASGIIGLLEVIESDITKNLAGITSEEESAVAEYKSMSRKNEIDTTSKEKDVEYKVKEMKELDKSTAENTEDRTTVQTELDAVLEYLSKIEDQCIAKPEAYEERVRRREAEIAGLKQALDTLESETALVQRSRARRTLRGGLQ